MRRASQLVAVVLLAATPLIHVPQGSADGASMSFECDDGPGEGGGWWVELDEDAAEHAPVDGLAPAGVFCDR